MAVSKRLRFEVFKRDNHTCRYCGRSAPDVSLTIDHVIPVALGGPDQPDNLVTACAECNGGKSSVSPDAPVVADVQEDALRWSRAIAAAAQQMLADQERRDANYEAFDRKWQSWTANGSPLPRPNGWRQSLDAFMAAGLPLAVLLGCVDVAMANDKLRPENRFRYVCGIAWKKVAELQKQARAAVGEETVTQDDSSAEDFAVNILYGYINDDEREIYLQKAREYEPDEDETPLGATEKEIAAKLLISDLLDERMALRDGIKSLFRQAGRHAVQEMREAAIADLESWGWDFDEWDVTLRVVHRIASLLAEDYLNGLSEGERNEWLACAATYHRTDDVRHHIIILNAAAYAKGEIMLKGVCAGPGKHGARCPKRVAFNVWRNDCPVCDNDCTGHGIWCEEHLEKALSGELRRPSGEQYDISDFQEIDESDPWGVR